MPEYKYKCPNCGLIRTFFHKITENPEYRCDMCKNILKRLILPGIGVIFSCGGFFNTDNRKDKIK